MRTFHCTRCQALVFFENVRCLNCQSPLAFLPDQQLMAALVQEADGSWKAHGSASQEQAYRLCTNYVRESVCNWAVSVHDPQPLCCSCRLTHIIPDLSKPENRTAWFRLEQAKRRLLYTLLSLKLAVEKSSADPGLVFEFLEDAVQGDAQRILTGHNNGLITVNIAEADDVYREQQRTQQGEPYRTLLGHLRHEVGHYYWNRLIAHSPQLNAFRALFGDERADYQRALQRHYRNGPPENWDREFVSAYAAAHPWEDWAESWAHFLHLVDALETAGAAGLSLRPQRPDEPNLRPSTDPLHPWKLGFDHMIEAWMPLTYVLNNLNRGLGLPDSYPFLLSTPVLRKLRFVHDLVQEFALDQSVS